LSAAAGAALNVIYPSADLALDVEINLGSGAIVDDFAAVEQQVERVDMSPFDVADGFSGFFDGCFRSLCETSGRSADYFNDLLSQWFLLLVQLGIVLRRRELGRVEAWTIEKTHPSQEEARRFSLSSQAVFFSLERCRRTSLYLSGRSEFNRGEQAGAVIAGASAEHAEDGV